MTDFKITGSGLYKIEDGRMAFVSFKTSHSNYHWVGLIVGSGILTCWHDDGGVSLPEPASHRIIGPWVEPDAPMIQGGYHKNTQPGYRVSKPSLPEHFRAQAALAFANTLMARVPALWPSDDFKDWAENEMKPEYLASLSVEYADKLIAALEGGE